MPSSKRKIGDIGENYAEDFLILNGYKITDRNYRVKNIGEIDIIAEKDRRLTFFEVKLRNIKHETNFPIEFSINYKKRKNLKKICQIYLNEKGRFTDSNWQVDAIFVKSDDRGKHKIEHLENILWEKYY